MSVQITTPTQIAILIQITNILQRLAVLVLLNEGKAGNVSRRKCPYTGLGWGREEVGQGGWGAPGLILGPAEVLNISALQNDSLEVTPQP